MSGESEVSFEWHRWAAISLLRATPLAEVIRTLVANGIDEAAAAALCSRILVDPTLEAAKWAVGHLYKLESVLDMREQLAELSTTSDHVPRRRGVSREAFLEEYYSTNRPVLLEDVCDDWPARRLWSPDYLVARMGDVEVEVMSGRTSGPAVELEMDRHRTRMRFEEYVSRVCATEWSNELYLVANNALLGEEGAASLWDDFSLDSRYMDLNAPRGDTFFWFGPAGTVTWLHHDVMNIVFHQVYGWKHFVLVPPLATHRVSNSVGVYSDVDPLAADLDRFPRFADVRQLQVTVGPGEALFIPVGWWHYVTALETSISVSSTSFIFPNEFAWTNPTMVL
jgi:Cupin-like domain